MNKMKKCLVRCLMMAALCLMLMQTVPAQAKSVNLGDKANLKNENFELKIPELEGIYVESENDGESLDASTAPTLSDSKLLLEICKRFRTAILKGKDSVDISDLKVPVTDKYLEMLGTLKYYCPYLDDFGLSLTNYYYDSSIVKTLYYSNHYSEEDTKKYIADVDEGLNRILSEVKSTDSTLTKCLVVHDYLVSHFEYDTGYSCYNASDHLVYGRGVCQAYAYLYKYILNTLGVTCYTTVSTTHMWNVVTISGKNYIVDATWDDPLYDVFGCSRHEWFLITDTQMMNLDGSINHEENSSLPCTSTTYSNAYFRNIESPVYVDGDYRYYTQNGNLYRYNVSSKKKTVLDTCSDFDGLFLYDGRIYYAQDKKIKTYNISTGKIGTFYTAKKEVFHIRKDGDDAAYLAGEYSWDEYGRPVSDLDYYTVSVTTVNKPSIKSCYNSSTGIKLTWSSIKDVTGYYIYRKTSSTD